MVPAQVIIHSPKASNNALELPFGASLFDLNDASAPNARNLAVVDGLRVLRQEPALVRLPESCFRTLQLEVEATIRSFGDEAPLLRVLLTEGRVAAAGRIAGAFRQMDRSAEADSILRTMRDAGFDVREATPFQRPTTPVGSSPRTSPLATRVQGFWEIQRESVRDSLPPPPDRRAAAVDILASIEERYTADAYHSLSMEGYQVSPELIERVRSGQWNPAGPEDRDRRDAMAARGYWLAFQAVKKSVKRILAGSAGSAPAETLRADHGQWYRALFQPSVAAGIIAPSDLAGYRNGPVYIKGSRHVPPRHDSVAHGMETVWRSVAAESEAGVSAVLSHWLVGYIHPYNDGNGRMARFVMNVLLVSGGYPWTVIPVDRRDEYMAALEAASCEGDIVPLAQLVGEFLVGTAVAGLKARR